MFGVKSMYHRKFKENIRENKMNERGELILK